MVIVRRSADFRDWHASCWWWFMLTRLARLFVIKTKFEAFLVIYGLGAGAVERGVHYMHQYPGYGGWALFACCPVAVFMAGARILDSIERSVSD